MIREVYKDVARGLMIIIAFGWPALAGGVGGVILGHFFPGPNGEATSMFALGMLGFMAGMALIMFSACVLRDLGRDMS
jgi:hypothetical protein